MMLILMIIQLVPIILIGYFLPAWKPVTAGGVFLLLIVSQLLILLRLFLKTWRYASVTSMMETDPVSMEVPNKY
jgi:membrane protein YdbS with pleckstrin-like domain